MKEVIKQLLGARLLNTIYYYRHWEWNSPDRFLQRVSGVIHVGANTGQERDIYKRHGLRVLWIEPISEVFETLKTNLKEYPLQSALQSLVTDQDNAEYAFHISNNNGQSSSILELKLHKDIWPEVSSIKTVTLRSTTLVSLLRKERIDVNDYDALIIDTQGSELLVLKGAATMLRKLKFIKTEVADFESYERCCQLKDIDQFLKEQGFSEYSRREFAKRPNGGTYYDVTYERVSAKARTVL
jgi:FkbM family methyltransferase